MDLSEFLKRKVEEFGNRTLLIGETGSISYGEFDRKSDRIAYGLEKLGLQRGDHVAVLHPNSPEVLLAYFGIIKMGGVTVPINTMYTPREIKFILENSDAKALLLREDFFPRVEPIRSEIPRLTRLLVRRDGETMEAALERETGGALRAGHENRAETDDSAIMFYTSGTTGHPKGVILTHGNFCFGGPNIAQSYGLREQDVTIAVLPMVHVFSVASPFFGSLSSGGKVVVLEQFKTDPVLDAMVKHRVTWFPGVPTMFTYLLNATTDKEYALSSLRMGLSGGASLPVEVLKNWEHKFGAKVIEVYGLTESTGLVTANPVYGVRKPGSIGMSVSGVEAKLLDKEGREVPSRAVGELVFKGPNATKGYYKLPEETSQKIVDGWVHTGDHAWRDEERYFYIVGREKELIISGGYNIYPREIEEVFHAFKGVNEVAVIGVPDPVKGEVPKAFVTLKKGVDVTERDIMEHCKKNLAPYKMPRVQFMEDLPKNPTGKIMKKELPRT